MATLRHGGSIQPHDVDAADAGETVVCGAQGGNG